MPEWHLIDVDLDDDHVKYAAGGIYELERSLQRHADFDLYMDEHEEDE